MKFVGVREAKSKLSECIETSKGEPVCVMNHGRPAVVLISVEGYDLEEVALMGDKQFWAMIAKRRAGSYEPLEEALADVERRRAERATGLATAAPRRSRRAVGHR